MAKDRFSIYVQLIFRIFDSLTFRAAKKEYFRFSCDNHAKILPKEDGFFVVVGNEKPKTILIQSGIYGTMEIDTTDISSETVLNLWAEPKKGYHLTADIHWLRVSCTPHERIFALEKEQEPAIRLLEKGEKGSTSIKIYKDRKWQLDGAAMVLCAKDNPDDFEIVYMQNMEHDICTLSTPLKKEHKKIKTGLYPLMHGTADAQGICEIAVRKQTEYLLLKADGQIVENNH